MDIRNAGLADIDIISRLAHSIWPQAYGSILSAEQLSYMLELIYSPASLRNQIENLQHNFFILSENGAHTGFASCSAKSPENPGVFRLHKIYILPGEQGKGRGQKLLNHVVAYAQKAGASVLELNVNRYNKAIQFYRKNGFTIEKEEDIDIGNGFFMNDFVMAKGL